MSKTREQVQTEATRRIIEGNYTGAIIISPRVGKTKTVIDAVRPQPTWCMTVTSPREDVRKNWIAEFKKWDLGFKIPSICHRSLAKIDENLDVLIIDECQTLSIAQMREINAKKPKRILFVSGTVNSETRQVLSYQLKFKILYEYTIEEAIRDGIVSDFSINVVNCTLDDEKRNVLTGPKGRQFYTTEKANYTYLTQRVEEWQLKAKMDGSAQRMRDFFIRERANFIYTAPTKIEACRGIIEQVGGRMLIFTARTAVADKLSPYSYHSLSKEKDYLTKFINGEVNKLSTVDMVSMGLTIPGLRIALLHQMQSNSEMSLQKILRTCNIEEGKEPAEIWITKYKDTVDQNWVHDALFEVPANKVFEIEYEGIKEAWSNHLAI